MIAEKFDKCSGSGTINQNEILNIKVPKGTPDGLTLRFSQKGNAGERGGKIDPQTSLQLFLADLGGLAQGRNKGTRRDDR